jgi:hypothetical protein
LADVQKKTEVTAKKDVMGGIVEGSGNTFTKVNYTLEGNTINIIQASDSLIEVLKQIQVVKTEIPANRDEAMKEDPKAAQELADTNGAIDELLQKMNAVGGTRGTEIKAGDVTISRVELLLKKAIALKAESVLDISEYFDRNRARVESYTARLVSGGYASQEAYYADLFKDFDYSSFKAKLTEASGFLEEAGRLDPTNVEVLLNKIETLGFLAANAPMREWPSIYENIAHLAATVIAYRRAPMDDAERFQLAQATYYQAFSRLNLYRQPQDREVLLDARSMFERLGRRDWVRQCDLVLQQLGCGAPPAPGAYEPGMKSQPQMPGAQGPPPPPTGGFQPYGRWQMNFGSGSAAMVVLSPDGSFQGVVTLMGMNHQVVGRWAFMPMNGMLQFQGLADGYIPFNSAIMIKSQYGDGYYAVDSTGDTCILMRV